MADNPAGPTDRSVPVMRVQAAERRLLAVLFGCACHNTTLTGRDNVIAGDYAGFAQEMIERDYGEAMALFMSGCGADANPSRAVRWNWRASTARHWLTKSNAC